MVQLSGFCPRVSLDDAAVSIKWVSMAWASLLQEPYYLGTLSRLLILEARASSSGPGAAARPSLAEGHSGRRGCPGSCRPHGVKQVFLRNPGKHLNKAI